MIMRKRSTWKIMMHIAIVGIGIESSSFKHGFVHEGMMEADILIAAGKVVTIRADNECALCIR